MDKFKKIFLQLRLSKKFSQEEMSKALGISKSTIAMWETGKRLPSPDMFELIADYFNVDIDYLYGRTDIKRHTLFDEFGDEYINSTQLNKENRKTSIDFLDTNTLKKLNKTNIEKVNVYSQNLLNIQNMEDNSYLEVNAAHSLPNASPEDIQHDEDIMNDENF